MNNIQTIISYVNRIDLGPFVRIDVETNPWERDGGRYETVLFRITELVPTWREFGTPYREVRRGMQYITYERMHFELKEFMHVSPIEEIASIRDEEEFYRWFMYILDAWTRKKLEDSVTVHPPGYRPEPRGRERFEWRGAPYHVPQVDHRNPYITDEWVDTLDSYLRERRTADSTDVQQEPQAVVDFTWNEEDLTK